MRRINPVVFFLLLSTSALADGKPVRVIPMMPSLAELALDIGLPEDGIVGVAEYTDFPESLKKKPSIGTYTKPSLERIIELKPDLVIVSRDGSSKEAAARLEKLKVPVLIVGTETLADMREAYPVLAKALGRETEGKIALARFDSKLAEIAARTAKRKKEASPRVLLQVGEDPLIVAAGRNFLNEGLGLLGAKNAYPDPAQSYPRVSAEDVLAKDPDVVVLVAFTKEEDRFENARKRWTNHPDRKATRAGKVITLHSDGLVRPGPRFPDGLRDLEKAIYGDL